MNMPYLIRTDPKDPRGDRIQIVTFGEPTPIAEDNSCLCDRCKNSEGCKMKPLTAPYTSCVSYKYNRTRSDKSE